MSTFSTTAYPDAEHTPAPKAPAKMTLEDSALLFHMLNTTSRYGEDRYDFGCLPLDEALRKLAKNDVSRFQAIVDTMFEYDDPRSEIASLSGYITAAHLGIDALRIYVDELVHCAGVSVELSMPIREELEQMLCLDSLPGLVGTEAMDDDFEDWAQ